jgi:ribosomal subunit interface protein
MSIQITSDNIELTDSMVSLAKSKIARFRHHIKDVPEDLRNIRVVMDSGPNKTFSAKIEMKVEGTTFVADETEFSLETALIRAVEEVDRQYRKSKSKTESGEWKEKREMKRFSEDY